MPAPGKMTNDEARQLLERLFAATIASVRGEDLIQNSCGLEGDRWICRAPGRAASFDLPPDGRVVVVGAGKATASLAKGLEDQLGERIDRGLIIVKYGHTMPLRRIRQIEAGHPVPDQRGLDATREMLRLLENLEARDRVFVLLSGGASALLVAPVDGVSLADKAVATDLLLRSEASIGEINAVRKALSRVKGGRLLDHIAPARAMTLLISDVPGDAVGTVGSGPTIRETPPMIDPLEVFVRHSLVDQLPTSVLDHLRNPRQASIAPSAVNELFLLADSAAAVAEVDRIAAGLGMPVFHVDTAMQGNTHVAARQFSEAMTRHVVQGLPRPCLFVAAGETTLRISGPGRGGRNQEFALVAAQQLAGTQGCLLLAAGTDGTDGPTEAAGAFADSTTCERAARMGLSVSEALDRNDSNPLLRAIGDLLVTGPTGTNVMDLVLGLVF